MGNFYKDNKDIENVIDALDLTEVATLLEEDFKFAKEYDFAPKDAADAIDNYKRAIDICGDVMANRIAPLAEETDAVGSVLNADGSVTYAPGIKLALELFGKTGLLGVQIPYYLGGLNMPCTVLTACNDIVSRGDASLMNIFGLQGIADTINMFGDEEMKKTYIPKLVTGEWTGAMVLTEPDAGSDLQSVKTTAYQDADGNWFVNGVKRFITNGCGEVLLVLARTEEGTTDGRGLSCLLVEKGPWVKVRRLENKLGIHGSPTCELVYKNAKAELCGRRKFGLIKYVMALMNGARLGIAAQSVGISQMAYNEALAYAKDRKQFGQAIVNFPAVYEMISNIKARLDAGRALLYQTARYVDIYKGLEDIERTRKLTDEEKAELKLYQKLASACTPLAKGMNSEYANLNAYDSIQVHGGSGYMLEYACQRLYRDARITSIYEGTTQLQTVAALPHITTGTYSQMLEELEAGEVAAEYESLKARTKAMDAKFNEAIEVVKAANNNEFTDLCCRHLYELAANCVMSQLLLRDATKSPELFDKSMKVYLNLAEAEVAKHYNFVKSVDVEAMESYRKA